MNSNKKEISSLRKSVKTLPLIALQPSGHIGKYGHPIVAATFETVTITNSTKATIKTPLSTAELTELDLPLELESRLFEHQKHGVLWLYKLHQTQLGGILGDGNIYRYNLLYHWQNIAIIILF
jgi:SNF2 family DNA or RNA helicase